VSLLAEVDGNRVAFSGDLIHSPGKAQTVYDLQYAYGEHEGVDLSEYSLRELIRWKPSLVCPSHGREIRDPAPGLEALASKLGEWFRYWHPGGTPLTSQLTGSALTPHVIAHAGATSTFYAIVSESGKGLFIDYGCASWNFFQAALRTMSPRGRLRFLEHSIAALRDRHGLRQLDVAIPTHMHDDHLAGLPHLKRHHGTRVWCFENFADVIENPGLRNLGCTFGEPVTVDRRLRHGEKFEWEGFQFEIVHSPGHTEYQSAILARIDGKRIAFTGDALFDYAGNGRPSHNLIYRNQVRIGDHLRSLRAIRAFEPDWIAPGHGKPFALTPDNAAWFEERLRQQDAILRGLVAHESTDFGLDPAWIRVEPYLATVAPGETLELTVHVRNHGARPMEIAARFVLPKHWRSSPERVAMSAPAKGTIGRLAIPLEVWVDGRRVGQIAEMVMEEERPSLIPMLEGNSPRK
jgi:glyoxylase-like metal-dependent hydrolase (beta-lactamase superfamily II)